jgi:hypothetical protein
VRLHPATPRRRGPSFHRGSGAIRVVCAVQNSMSRLVDISSRPLTSVLRASAVCLVLCSYACGQSIAPSPTAPSPTISSISVTMIGLAPPGMIQMIATERVLDTGRDLTSIAAWQNSNPDVATVSTTGRLTLVGPGTTTVTATYQGKSGSLSFTTTYPLPGPWDY